MTPNKAEWPEKLKTFTVSQLEFDRGFNTCLDACNKWREAQPKLDIDIIYGLLKEYNQTAASTVEDADLLAEFLRDRIAPKEGKDNG